MDLPSFHVHGVIILTNASRTGAEMNLTCYFHGVPVYADTEQPKNLITFIQRGDKMKGKEEAKSATVVEEEWRVPDQAKLLAEEHWEWIKKLLDTQFLVTERLFKDGFKHGWKHAKGATCSTKKT